MSRNPRKNRAKQEKAKTEIGTPVAVPVSVFFLAVVGLLLLHSAKIDLASELEYILMLISAIGLIWNLFGIRIPKLNFIKSRAGKITFVAVSVSVILACLTARYLYHRGFSMEIHRPEPDETEQSEPLPEPMGGETADASTPKPILVAPSGTKEPEYQDISLDSDTDILEPQTVISNAEALTAESAIILKDGPEHLLDIIDPTLKNILPAPAAENKSEWEPRLSDTIKETVNSDSQPSNSEINRNTQFGRLTQRANELENKMTGLDAEKLFEIIDCREKAFNIFETQDLRLLLANDYHKAARYYRLNADWANAYDYYVRSIEYRMRHIRTLPKIGDQYFEDLYEVAILYQCIGDIPTITEEYRAEAYFLSTCFMEVVSKNTADGESAKRGFLSSYYAGMINHKQGLLGLRSHVRGTDIFINDGIRYYEKSLNFEDYQRQRSYQYEYLADLCQCALDYLSQRWSAVLEPSAYYKKQQTEYLKKAM